MMWRSRSRIWYFWVDRTPATPASGGGEPTLVGQPMGMLLLLTYS